ncbi:response regulator transcription factor [Paenibacillus agilis]|uniref:Response regulator transcription factor n=1 Tax=Paenibacillus agilis TaxID=3020863 RepID=A0A559J0P1_9BACL|nr:response regulator transcription factor [Paenibacillus agilis]TVX93458.1 response regulator transcription factor [Paenibacillus agilis]
MSYSVLLIEDDANIRNIMCLYFEKEQWQVHEAEDGETALDMIRTCCVDLIILDIMLPKRDGWSICRWIRGFSCVPIIIVTAYCNDDAQLMGYEFGADDYITKPFSPKILVARSTMLVKRAEGTVGLDQQIISFGHVTIHKQRKYVEVNRSEVGLAPKEYELLEYLVRNKGIILSREAILDHVWGFDFYGDHRVVDTHIRKIRAKLGVEARHIHTVKGVGYMLEVKNME